MSKTESLIALLSTPDPVDLGRRAHVLTQPGHPDRALWWQQQPQVYTNTLRHARDEARAA